MSGCCSCSCATAPTNAYLAKKPSGDGSGNDAQTVTQPNGSTVTTTTKPDGTLVSVTTTKAAASQGSGSPHTAGLLDLNA